MRAGFAKKLCWYAQEYGKAKYILVRGLRHKCEAVVPRERHPTLDPLKSMLGMVGK